MAKKCWVIWRKIWWKELRYNSQHSQLIYHIHFTQKMIPNGENLEGTLPTLLTSYPHPS